MPSLKILLQELRKIGADLDEVRVPGHVFDDLIQQGSDNIEENPVDE